MGVCANPRVVTKANKARRAGCADLRRLGWLSALAALSLAGCVSTSIPQAKQGSPLSPQTETAPVMPVATSLTHDPLATPPPPAHHHHHHPMPEADRPVTSSGVMAGPMPASQQEHHHAAPEADRPVRANGRVTGAMPAAEHEHHQAPAAPDRPGSPSGGAAQRSGSGPARSAAGGDGSRDSGAAARPHSQRAGDASADRAQDAHDPAARDASSTDTPSQPAADGGGATRATVYVCPMHPDVRQSTPGTCPRCGMKLVPAPKPAPQDPKPHEHHGH
jgi:hypothetical protein